MKFKHLLMLAGVSIATNICAVEYYCNWQSADKPNTLSQQKELVSHNRTDDAMQMCIEKAKTALADGLASGDTAIVWMEKKDGAFERGTMFKAGEDTKKPKLLWEGCYNKPTAECEIFHMSLNPGTEKKERVAADKRRMESEEFANNAKNWSGYLIPNSESGDVEGVKKELARRGININGKNKYGFTALMKAAQNGKEEVVVILLQAGADATLKNEKNDNKTAADYATTQKIKDLINKHSMTSEAPATRARR